MSIHKIITAIAMFLGISQFAQAEALNLKYGVNNIDINADGLDDVIVKSRWDNMNAHSFDKYLIMVQLEGEENKERFYEVPLGDSYKYSFTTSEGADCILTDYKFVKNTSGLLEVTRYSRNFGETYGSVEDVTITKYLLVDTVKETGALYPGDPKFYLRKEHESTSKDKHCDVQDLMN